VTIDLDDTSVTLPAARLASENAAAFDAFYPPSSRLSEAEAARDQSESFALPVKHSAG
jgi:hypothetical protein